MRLSCLMLLVAFSFSAVKSASSVQTVTIKWHDSTRDIFIDNELDRSAQFLTSDNPIRAALISPKLDKAIVLEIDSRTLSVASKDAFKFSADRADATSQVELQPIGKFTRIDGPVYSFAVDGKPVLIRSHPGQTGEMTLDKLWETVPVWKYSMEAYRPDTATIASLKSIDKDTDLTLFFGTWCGDSKYYMPRLLKSLREAENNKLHVKLVGVDNQFREPVDVVQPRKLTNVPTVIVERKGSEIGRIVETPGTSTFEQDLVRILRGETLTHNGRWDRGGLIASGTYAYTDSQGKAAGSETFELFNASEGGFFVHSRAISGGASTEVYQRIDTKNRPAFAEITRVQGDNRIRTRINIDRHTMTARVRGSVSGVITQTLEVPDGFFISSPVVAVQGWAAPDAEGHAQLSEYLFPYEFEDALGTLVPASCDVKGEEKFRVNGVEREVRHVVRTDGRRGSEWWIDSQLGIPVRGRANNLGFELTSLSVNGGK